jgi:hypothetical protein
MANPFQTPGTMVVPQDPWESALSQYQQALVDLDGDGRPDAVVNVPAQQLPPQAYDSDGRPRVPASGAAEMGLSPYPHRAGPYPPNPNLAERFAADPGRMSMNAFGGAMNMLSATGDAMGPTGMPISMLGRMGAAAVRTPGAAIGRGPSPQFQIDRLKEEIAPLWQAESRTGRPLPHNPRPMPGTPLEEIINSLLQERDMLMRRAPDVQNMLSARVQEFNNRLSSPPPQALTYQPSARGDAIRGGMVPRSGAAIRPEADPWAPARMARESEAIERGRRSMQQQDLINRGAQMSPEDAVSGTADRLLGVVRERMGAAANTAPEVPAGAYERLLANDPGVKMLLQNYGMTFDDLAGIMANRGYAVPPNATFNASVLQPRNSGLFGGMNADEKAFRDALQRRNARPGGTGQGNVF